MYVYIVPSMYFPFHNTFDVSVSLKVGQICTIYKNTDTYAWIINQQQGGAYNLNPVTGNNIGSIILGAAYSLRIRIVHEENKYFYILPFCSAVHTLSSCDINQKIYTKSTYLFYTTVINILKQWVVICPHFSHCSNMS